MCVHASVRAWLCVCVCTLGRALEDGANKEATDATASNRWVATNASINRTVTHLSPVALELGIKLQ